MKQNRQTIDDDLTMTNKYDEIYDAILRSEELENVRRKLSLHEFRLLINTILSAANFQDRVRPWVIECFGQDIAYDKTERNFRFLEEALELVQSCGCARHEAHMLVDYVFDRATGLRKQEVGGVMVTLAALCSANDLDMDKLGEVELERCWKNIERIREKQKNKKDSGPLP